MAPPPAINPALLANACYKWQRAAKSQTTDLRLGVFSWVDAAGSVNVLGGCDSGAGTGSPTCANTVLKYDATTHAFKTASINVESNLANYMTSSGVAYEYVPAANAVYDFGGRRQGPAGRAESNVLGKLEDHGALGYSWAMVSVTGTVPEPVLDATLTNVNGTLFLIGGFNAQATSDAVYTFQSTGPSAGVWTKRNTTGKAPTARSGHSATVVGRQIYVFGGSDGFKMLGDLYALDTATFTWTEVTTRTADPALVPSARAGHAAVRMPGKLLFVIGGGDAAKGATFNDVHVLELSTNTWVAPPATLLDGAQQLATKQAAAVRYTVKGFNQILLFGGAFVSGQLTTIYNVYEPQTLDLVAVCPKSCLNKGTYVTLDGSASCKCADGFSGKFCEATTVCPANCNKPNGECVQGKCVCQLGFGDVDCGTPVCPNQCSGKGDCASGRCLCKPGSWGLDCSQQNCPSNCNGRGLCQEKGTLGRPENWCKCLAGFSGPGCEYWANDSSAPAFLEEPAEEAVFLELEVEAALTAESLTEALTPVYDAGYNCLPNNCSGHGYCRKEVGFGGQVQGRCECQAGFAGHDCSGECALHCMGPARGTCVGADPMAVTCECKTGYEGLGCYKQYCANQCSNRGACVNNKCFCEQPYSGGACEQDTSCSDAGTFHAGRCTCKAGRGGRWCEQTVTCEAKCENSGTCVGAPLIGNETIAKGVCKCQPGWTGPTCTEKVCPGDCHGNGYCHKDTGHCSCYSGYTKNDCSLMLQCPANCTGTNGVCKPDVNRPGSNVGVCQCNSRWSGRDCSLPGCPDGCNNHGTCEAGQCLCHRGYAGTACEFECPDRCSNHGVCVAGQCKCHPGFSGPNCNSTGVCPGVGTPKGECSGNGVCFRAEQKCFCHPGYTGKDCSEEHLCEPRGCGIHGRCANSRCYCDPGWQGDNCEIESQCQGGCNHRGFCNAGKCFCFTGFTGDACEKLAFDVSCPNNCTGKGVCRYGRCFCADGQTGADCSVPLNEKECRRTPQSRHLCENRGRCEFSQCFCNPGYAGKFCEQAERCPNGCAPGQGVCLRGKCHCLPGFKGVDCSEELQCEGSPLPCSGNGICIQGTCSCLPYYAGSACEKITVEQKGCKNNCTDGGKCHMGRCFCVEGRTGPDCSQRVQGACPRDCSGQGTCAFGQCWCKPGFAGKACETEIPCSKKCLENGVCAHGKCFCVAGWAGKDCDVKLHDSRRRAQLEHDITAAIQASADLQVNKGKGDYCLGGCGHYGVCVNNTCHCAAPMYGPNCKLVRQGALASRCGNNCNGKGECLLNKCVCQPGYGGQFCEKKEPYVCPNNCANAGVCFLGRCLCEPGRVGADCSGHAPCVGGCGNGVCLSGRCACVSGWTGANCNVSAPGAEIGRKMQFRETVTSSASSSDAVPFASVIGLSDCDNNCGANGLCVRKQCYCKPGFSGPDCSAVEALPVPVVKMADVASKPLAAEHTSYLLLAGLCFGGGAIACYLGQLAWSRHRELRRQRATKNILKPLLHSIDQ